MHKVSDILNNTVYCKLAPSPIHGIGVFAIQDIAKGTVIDFVPYSICRMTEAEFQEVLPEIQKLVIQRNTFLEEEAQLHFFHPNANQLLQSFMNHSEDANTNGHNALRDIKKGEEITENYKKLTIRPLHWLTMDRNNRLV